MKISTLHPPLSISIFSLLCSIQTPALSRPLSPNSVSKLQTDDSPSPQKPQLLTAPH